MDLMDFIKGKILNVPLKLTTINVPLKLTTRACQLLTDLHKIL